MKSLSKTEVFILGSTLLLVSYVRNGLPVPVPVEGVPEAKPTCTGQEGVRYKEDCELPQNSSCYLPCLTDGAICSKPMQQQSGDPETRASEVKARCACPDGRSIDEGGNNCTEIMEKREEKASMPSSEQSVHSVDAPEGEGGAGEREEKENPIASTENPGVDVDEEGKSAGSNTTDSASVHSAEEPGEAAKSKSNVGLAVGIITLTMFAMIFVFLVRHKINNAVRRMCGGSQPVPTSEN